MKSGYCITRKLEWKLDYLQENVTVGVGCLSNLACLCYRVHTEKCEKHFCISCLFNIQKFARCVVKNKTSNRRGCQCFSSVAN